MKKRIAAAAAAAVCLCAVTAYGIETPSAIFVNGSRVDAEAFISEGTTYVPLRAVSEMLGAKVEWNEDTSEINITLEGGGEPYEYAVSQISPSTVAIVGSYAGETTATYQDRYAEGIAHGTGVIVSSSGEIVTNAHVVKDMTAMIVILSSGEGYSGTVKYIDDELDLAVVKIEKSGLTAARFADESEIAPGCRVVAVGTPVSMSLRNSVSAGIISGVNRGVNSSCKLIQTDAAVNPGNSGGPLVNLRGEVVGICSSGYTGIGIEGLSFAIPVSDVNYALEHFRTYGRINRPSFGAELEESLAAKYGLPGGGGLTFRKIAPGGAAANAGIEDGDILLEVDGVSMSNISDWSELSKSYLPGESAALRLERGGEIIGVSIVFD